MKCRHGPSTRSAAITISAMDITRSGTRKEELLVPPDRLRSPDYRRVVA